MKGAVGELIEENIRAICEWKRVEVLELNVREDHVHAVVVVPPRLAVSDLMGALKGKTAIALFQKHKGLKRKPYWGNHFWSRGYCVSTVGLDETKIRRYVRYQEENERLDEDNEQQFGLFQRPKP